MDVKMLTDTSVRVSWERILNIPEITHYTVFYSKAGNRKRQAAGEDSRNVSSSSSSVDIEGLSGGARSYQFVVIAVATVDNVEIPGDRPTDPFTFPSSSSDGGKWSTISESVCLFNVQFSGSFSAGPIIGGLVLSIAVVVAVVVVILGFLWLRR